MWEVQILQRTAGKLQLLTGRLQIGGLKCTLCGGGGLRMALYLLFVFAFELQHLLQAQVPKGFSRLALAAPDVLLSLRLQRDHPDLTGPVASARDTRRSGSALGSHHPSALVHCQD